MTKPVHIQHVVLSLQPGGLENGVVNVVNGLDSSRFRSSVCCLKEAGEFATRITNTEARIREMGLLQGNDILLPWRLGRLFRQTQTDIVHTRNQEAFFYGFLGATLGGVRKVIHSEHGRAFPDKPHRRWLQRQLSRYTDSVFAVSEQLRRDLVTYIGIPASRIEVLYNGVDLGKFRNVDRSACRRRIGIPDGEIVIGSVGRLAPVKNHALLLKVVPQLHASHVSVMLVGDGPERPMLEALAERLQIRERVRFLGHRDDVRDLLTAMDIFVLPSSSEGMSNTLLEAMAAGVAVVASNVGGNREIVRDPHDGYIFPSGDSECLRKCLNMLCASEERRQVLGKSGHDRVAQSFSIQAMIDRYEDLYRRVHHGTGKPPT